MGQQYKNSWYCTFVINTSIFSIGLMIAYAMSSLNPLIPVILRIYNSTYEKRHGEALPPETWTVLLTLTMSILMIGGFFGSLSFKFILNHLTRKQVMLAVHVCAVIGNLIVALGVGIGGSYEAFIVGRFVLGFASGLGLSVIPLIFTETSVPHRRPLYGGVMGTSLQVGVVIGIFFAWSKILGTDDRWLGVIILGMVYSIVYFVCSFGIDETPFQTLILHGEDEALKVLRKLRSGSEDDLLNEMKDLVADVATKGKGNSVATFKEVLTTPQYRRHFFGAVILFSFIMASGVNNVLFYSDQIFINAGLDAETVTPATLGVMAVSPILSAVLVVFVTRGMEARRLLIAGCVILIIGDAFVTACLATYKEVPEMSSAAIAAVCVFYIGFTIINLVCYVVIGAITIDRTRPVCTNVGAAGLWFFAWFVGFMAPYFQIWISAYGFLVWMGFTILVLFYTIFFVPNVGGKTPDQIQAFYKRGKNLTTTPSSVPLEPSI